MKHLKIQFDVFYSFAIRNCQFPAVSCTSSIPELDRNPSARREVDGDWKALLDAAATDVPSGVHPQWSPRVSILSRGLVTWMIWGNPILRNLHVWVHILRQPRLFSDDIWQNCKGIFSREVVCWWCSSPFAMYDSESADIYLNDAIATNDLPWLCMAPCCRMLLLGAQAPRRWHWMTRAGGGLVLFRSQNTRVW